QRGAFVTARARAAASEAAGQVSARTVKFFADGVIEAGTAALLEPYDDAPHSCGLPVWEPAELAAAATAFDVDGFQLHIHAIGDAGVRAALGVVANFEPLWTQLDAVQTELTLPRLGTARGARQYPMASLLASGAVLSMGSDWPVSSHRPLSGLPVAVTRQTPAGLPGAGWIPRERLPPESALAAYSSGVAYQAGEERLWGSVSVGKRADLVWLEADPLVVEPAGWPQLRVLGTWLGGRATWRRQQLRSRYR
nr:amidohydrolase family protein [Sporichthyaceae bacterium]